MAKFLRVTFGDGVGVYDVPLDVIARDRAKHYAREFDGDTQRSLDEDTMPLFTDYPFEAEDWAANNMDWRDVKAHAIHRPELTKKFNLDREWMSANKEVITYDDDVTEKKAGE